MYKRNKYHEHCALLVAPIVALSVYRFDMKFSWVFSKASVLHVRKIGLYFVKSITTNLF